MLNLILPKTSLENDLQMIEDSFTIITNYALASVHELNNILDKFWNLPDDRLLNILNSLGIEKVQNLFNTQDDYAQFFNSLLNNRGVSNVSAKTGKPRELIINNEGLFELVPLPTPVEPPTPSE
jgi:hypothetical protein